MFHDNLLQLRKLKKMTQEEVAEHLDISRQTLSKWECGDSAPDLNQSAALARLFDVSLDDLVSYSPAPDRPPHVPPKGKHAFGCVRVGEKGQIVIPARARKIFHIQPGDNLIVLGDEDKGLALIPAEEFFHMVEELKNGIF